VLLLLLLLVFLTLWHVIVPGVDTTVDEAEQYVVPVGSTS
jgi:hypothetical protein